MTSRELALFMHKWLLDNVGTWTDGTVKPEPEPEHVRIVIDDGIDLEDLAAAVLELMDDEAYDNRAEDRGE